MVKNIGPITISEDDREEKLNNKKWTPGLWGIKWKGQNWTILTYFSNGLKWSLLGV